MRCQSEYLPLSAGIRHATAISTRLSDRQFIALPTPRALSILLEWGFTPSNSPAAAASVTRRLRETIRKFLESSPPRRRDGDTSGRNSVARSEDKNSHKKAQNAQKKSGVALLDRGSPNPHGAEGDSPPRIADRQVRIPP